MSLPSVVVVAPLLCCASCTPLELHLLLGSFEQVSCGDEGFHKYYFTLEPHEKKSSSLTNMRNQGLPKSQRERNRRRAQGAESSQGVEEDDTEVDQEKTATSSSRSSKSSAAASSASVASNNQDASAGPPEDDRVWVQCNTCDKWRSLPNTVDPTLLPDIWFCELNSYDSERNCCEVRLCWVFWKIAYHWHNFFWFDFTWNLISYWVLILYVRYFN